MGLLADYAREPLDTDIVNAYHRVSRIENHYATSGTVTLVKSTIFVSVYKDRAARDANGEGIVAMLGIDDPGNVNDQPAAYAKLATYLGVPNVEV